MTRSRLPEGLARIVRPVLKASDPRTLLRKNLSRRGHILRAGPLRFDLGRYRHVYVVGAGKASGRMASALEGILGRRITGGLVVVKYGYAARTSRIRMMEAAHPVPDKAGVRAARRIAALLEAAGERDLVILLLSGGGSALMPLPVDGVTLAQKQRVTKLLLKSGATINEVNVIRKHLSRIKGGGLARMAAPASLLTLILSDVPGNPLDTIASGPTVPDPSTYEDAVQILNRYRLWPRLPRAVQRHLTRGRRGEVPETLKKRDPGFRRLRHVILGDNQVPLQAAARAARSAGFQTLVLTSYLEGEAREVARVFGAIAREYHRGPDRKPRRFCLLASGETTVTVRGSGLGGRCQEFALAASLEISDLGRTLVAAFGTDGTDGPTQAAGAYADERTVRKAVSLGLSPLRSLEANDSFELMKRVGQLIWTGPTRTNLNDLYLLITYA